MRWTLTNQQRRRSDIIIFTRILTMQTAITIIKAISHYVLQSIIYPTIFRFQIGRYCSCLIVWISNSIMYSSSGLFVRPIFVGVRCPHREEMLLFQVLIRCDVRNKDFLRNSHKVREHFTWCSALSHANWTSIAIRHLYRPNLKKCL